MRNDTTSSRKDHGTKKKTPFQLDLLEKYYSEEKYPKQEAMEEYAALLNLTYKQVRTWFAERRRKEKREMEARGKPDCNAIKWKFNRIANEGQPTSQKKCRSLPIKAQVKHNTPSDCCRVCDPKSVKFKRKYGVISSDNLPVGQKNHRFHQRVLFSKEYILKKVFRKDGPPLGVEFDSLPASSFCFHKDSGLLRSDWNFQGVPKRRKILASPTVKPGPVQVQTNPCKNYGIGKGLMTAWRATNPDNARLPSKFNFVDGGATMPFKSAIKERPRRSSGGGQQVPSGKGERPRTVCRLLNDAPKFLEQSNLSRRLLDDEELELRELQTGSTSSRCSVHFASNGSHGCPLCKDLLAEFPPQIVKMRQPLSRRPWDSSPELVKKLFKIFRFLYGNAATIKICPYTLDDLAHAFTDKDSMLLGKIHVALLELFLLDVQRALTAGLIPRASKDHRFLSFLHFVREQECDMNIWNQFLNPLTWTEVLRQVLVAAGFGLKSNTARTAMFNKERNQMEKYGLRSRTLKGELFAILSEQGNGGLTVCELAKAPQVVALDLPNTNKEVEEQICLTLSSDITLFEKIAPSAYRLRIGPDIKGKEGHQSDSDDSGSVDDNFSASSSNDESDASEELNSTGQRTKRYKRRCKRTGQQLTEYTEIDESYSGEAWVLGLMEGEYSDLSINEKLDVLIALLDLAGAASVYRMEESGKTLPATMPNSWCHGSGAKIKKSSTRSHQQDLEIISGASKGVKTSIANGTEAEDKSQPDIHQVQSVHLGYDRRYNSYWLFLGPCDAHDPGHRRVYFESSEDGHWKVIDTAQAFDALLSSLDCRGTREAHLFASLDKRANSLCQAMDDWMTNEFTGRQERGCYSTEFDSNSGDGSSAVSDVDNISRSLEPIDRAASGGMVLELGKTRREEKQKWDRLQAFDKWVWNGFYSHLNAIKRTKRSYMETLTRCQSCHDLYLRDEKHCRICHLTFELDFDLEEKYAVHVATCRTKEDSCEFPKHKVLPSQLQALKAAIHAIEACMPEAALSAAWTRSAHNLWVKRLQRTSSLPELLQVVTDFVGVINEEWLYGCASKLGSHAALDDIIVCFQTMPQTTSAVALWMVKLDALIAPCFGKAQPQQAECRPQLRGRPS
ncbi:homeobox-DDT domain protein RLT3-like isoform X2 [Asparagus officinalis]|uniref:homeobox-DDT domain protein RLT3-like isoform X2 n=1 Tax=Asparagus officinalis TaxID=4686 RepID=UPI00098E797C|nr:homeobox-DDT domain protein RLT3-like isoform X2 [Asparagus officinalis]